MNIMKLGRKNTPCSFQKNCHVLIRSHTVTNTKKDFVLKNGMGNI